MTDEPAPSDGSGPRGLVTLAVIVYGALAGVAWLWLAWRDRIGFLRANAVGDHGVGAAVLVGTGVGIALALVGAFALRRVPAYAAFESEVRTLLGPQTDGSVAGIALCSGLGEELLFRGAALDAIGPWWSAALFGALHLGPGAFRVWPLLAAPVGVLLGFLVESGYGLLSASIAHAVTNYLSLRRIACP